MLIDTLKWRCWHPIPQKMEYITGNPGYPQDCNYMASTNVFDADDKEMWEGDIVFILATSDRVQKFFKFNYQGASYAEQSFVSYNAYNSSLRLCINSPGYPVGKPLVDYDKKDIYVMGNIYENPDLRSARICSKCQTLDPQIPECVADPLCAACLKVSPPLDNSKPKSGKLVSMGLTERDITNAEKLQEKFHCANKAEAVSAALSITVSLMDRLANGEELYIRTKAGITERLIIPGLG